jgi:serine/threonine-protein kinase
MTCEPTVLLGPDTVIGSYRLVRELGRGGMATVYESRHTVLPRRAAIKVMHGELRLQPGMATRIVQEAAILEDIQHPGVVRVFDCALLPDHRPWIAMELVEGETLAQRFLRTAAMPAAEVARLLAEVADVLAAVHARGIVHRDLKPDNVILVPGDRDYPLRVIDWGVARLGPIGRITLDGMTPGTPIYMAPEQATGRDIGAPCDIYSLGVLAYEALSGRPPYDGRTLAEVVSLHLCGDALPLRQCSTAPRQLCELVHAMLDREPSLRPGAIELRQQARSIARELAHDYESFELVGGSRPLVTLAPTEDCVVDPEALETGITELLPAIGRPRWTPRIEEGTELAKGPPHGEEHQRTHVRGPLGIAQRERS